LDYRAQKTFCPSNSIDALRQSNQMHVGIICEKTAAAMLGHWRSSVANVLPIEAI
jgi:hypothetical protein